MTRCNQFVVGNLYRYATEDKFPNDYLNVELSLLRTDILHPTIQGNKYYKLKYNLDAAAEQQKTSLLTFGGAFSNHIYATAAAGKKYGFKTIGVIRGEEPSVYLNTLQAAKKMGMELHFIKRDFFRKIRADKFDDLTALFSRIKANEDETYVLPEGGTNELAVKGCEEILSNVKEDFNIVCLPVGTGGTLAGIINSLDGEKTVIGFSALNGGFLRNDVKNMLNDDFQNWTINVDYHFGGYGKWNEDLVQFINGFKIINGVSLCPIYTGKMMYGIFDLIRMDYFPKGTKILAIHTGGLQGVKSFNQLNSNILQ